MTEETKIVESTFEEVAVKEAPVVEAAPVKKSVHKVPLILSIIGAALAFCGGVMFFPGIGLCIAGLITSIVKSKQGYNCIASLIVSIAGTVLNFFTCILYIVLFVLMMNM